jgi:hypothetical protein
MGELRGIYLLREQVRIRDKHKCQRCGKPWQPGQRRLDVHHLDPNEEGDRGYSPELNKDMSKLITLCHKCHLTLPHIRMKISRINRNLPSGANAFDRDIRIDEKFNEGMSYTQIGISLGITKQRAHQIHKRYLRYKDQKDY